jgi:hypothetical protein
MVRSGDGEGVPLQSHVMDLDPRAEEDLPAATALIEEAAALLVERTPTFPRRVG